MTYSLIVRIVECSEHSGMANEKRQATQKRSLSRLKAGLKPWLLTFYGEPPAYLPKVQEDFAPGVEVVRVFDGPRRQTYLKAAYDTEVDCEIHPDECGCEDDDSPFDTYNYYLKAFFIKSSSDSLQANHFRFKAIASYRGNQNPRRVPDDEAWHQVEMTSSAGNTWTHERQGYSSCSIYDILCNKMETCSCDDPACEEGFAVSEKISIALSKSLTNSHCLCRNSLTTSTLPARTERLPLCRFERTFTSYLIRQSAKPWIGSRSASLEKNYE
jgi:hypothetical protein